MMTTMIKETELKSVTGGKIIEEKKEVPYVGEEVLWKSDMDYGIGIIIMLEKDNSAWVCFVCSRELKNISIDDLWLLGQ